MSFEIKNMHLNNRAFIGALKELGNEKLPSKTAWNVTRMIKQFDKALRSAGEGYVEIVNEYCVRDADGNIVPEKDEEGNEMENSYVIPDEKEDDFKTAMTQFMLKSQKIESNKLKVEDLGDAKLSATDFTILAPIFEEE